MILGFKQQFPWKEPTYFMEKILALEKIHTIRLDPHDRWKAGNSIQMAYGVRTKKYKQFNKGVSWLEKCVSIQKIDIHWKIITTSKYSVRMPIFHIDGILFTDFETLAVNDGFDSWDQFCRWFTKDFSGKIIHWTDFRY